MVDHVKVLIAEKNGQDLEYNEEYALEAENIPFDNSTNGFEAETVQEALTEVGASASPGFSFGRSGYLSDGDWLKRAGDVPSNRTGVTIGIDNPVVYQIACSNRSVDTYTITIVEHEGNQVNLNTLGSVSVDNATGGIFEVNFSATKGMQIAVQLTSSEGYVNDIGVDLFLKGNN